MNQQERVLFAIASRVLIYPSDDFLAEVDALRESVDDDISEIPLQNQLEKAFTALSSLPLADLKKLYVETFDLKARNGLYLTAHELGDSTKRGAALIKLQKIISTAGFERVDDELADFIPMLFEFLAVAKDSEDSERLVRRLAVAIHRVNNNLPDDNPYSNILSILMKYIFPVPTKEEIEKLEFEREEADLEELPYPIMYT